MVGRLFFVENQRLTPCGLLQSGDTLYMTTPQAIQTAFVAARAARDGLTPNPTTFDVAAELVEAGEIDAPGFDECACGAIEELLEGPMKGQIEAALEAAGFRRDGTRWLEG